LTEIRDHPGLCASKRCSAAGFNQGILDSNERSTSADHGSNPAENDKLAEEYQSLEKEFEKAESDLNVLIELVRSFGWSSWSRFIKEPQRARFVAEFGTLWALPKVQRRSTRSRFLGMAG
jgi:hypothetical protein